MAKVSAPIFALSAYGAPLAQKPAYWGSNCFGSATKRALFAYDAKRYVAP
jgi:hypothetical protein